ncbi:DUF5995 family protein [Rufibacter psychrotolerans]|uniref:DUF5995 family protein n=1 Tax=Rufibacter psychrotolerans TaxID=2812556 RepID=UPI0019681779|nr:DUF5995 family protein [Rufibacter sp. SYSU D00308]
MPHVQEPCTTIDDVIAELDRIVQHCLQTNDKAGYFAVLYYCVTCRVREGIRKKEFDDNARMERLDVLFANRYLAAWHRWKAGQKITRSWQVAFQTTTLSTAIILQHLLLGMNAHINLDLGIATAETMQGQNLQAIKNDFNRINAILKAMVDKVQDNLGLVSPLFRLLDVYGRDRDELLTGFSIQVARDGAWCFAEELSAQTGPAYEACLARRDQRIAVLGQRMAHPLSRMLRFTLTAIRTSEWRSPASTIRLLRFADAPAPAPALG